MRSRIGHEFGKVEQILAHAKAMRRFDKLRREEDDDMRTGRVG